MTHIYDIEYTDTYGGTANYSWVERHAVTMPDLTHYGYSGSPDGSYTRAARASDRELLRKAKALCGLTGVRGTVERYGDSIEFRPYRSCTVIFITYRDE